jgi:protease PrsW
MKIVCLNIITDIILVIPLAIAPGIAIALFIFFRDKYEKEPFRLLRACFLFGMLSIIPAIIFELIAQLAGLDNMHGIALTFIYALIGVGLVEEFSKFFFLRIYAYPKKEFNEPFDGIVYSVMIAMGFATLENIGYALSHGLGITLLRMFTAVPLHATCGIIMGFYVGLAKFRPRPGLFMATGIALATITHGVYDFFLFQQDYPALTLLAFLSLIAAVFFSFIAIRKSQKRSPFIVGKISEISAPPDKPPPVYKS